MEYLWNILVISCIYIILTVGLNLTAGYAGILSIGHAGFYAIGAYASALFALRLNLPFILSLLVAGLITTIAAFIIGFPTLRLRGDYLALATFGFGLIVYITAKNWVSLTKGPMGLPGIPKPRLFSYSVDSSFTYLLLVLGFTLLILFVIYKIVNSPLGRVFRAIRDDEVATLAIGKDTTKFKLIAFGMGAFLAGIAGSLYAHYVTFIDPSSFTITESILVLCMVVFGGLGSLAGSVVGAVTLVLLPELLRFVGLPTAIAAPFRQIIYGTLLVILVIKRPKGILGKYAI